MTTQEITAQIQAAKEVKVTNVGFTWSTETEQYYVDVDFTADDKKWKDQSNMCEGYLSQKYGTNAVDHNSVHSIIKARLDQLSKYLGVNMDRTNIEYNIKLKD